MSVMKGWIQGCNAVHGDKCVDYRCETQYPLGFRVINVVNMNIIESAQANLCIVQDDRVLKTAQIASMDKIDRSATFTIMAALNNYNGGGLPGYKRKPRIPCSSIWRPPHKVNGETRGIGPNGIGGLVDSSLWNRRATEELTWGPQGIARRRPPAKSNGVPISSRVEVRVGSNEDMIYQIPGSFEPLPEDIRTEYIVKDATSFTEYCEWAKDYTSRQLSYGTDFLNAFTGVANSLCQLLAFPTLFRLPEKYLPRCLMWSCPGKAGRRGEVPEIPSWSWVTSLSPVSYDFDQPRPLIEPGCP
ncbi:hypothetical protein F5Y11DRAFT_349242 [Daldinia sp. FL1419]|nr:hypothetical protein F5Y11DRAFT_349242 [Daldinia sp. FL1419]